MAHDTFRGTRRRTRLCPLRSSVLVRVGVGVERSAFLIATNRISSLLSIAAAIRFNNDREWRS